MPNDTRDTPWWPPKIGDRLRHFTLHSDLNAETKQVHALCVVVAVFRHNNRTLVTVAEHNESWNDWSYWTISESNTFMGRIWFDGPPPKRHERSPGVPCECCGGVPGRP